MSIERIRALPYDSHALNSRIIPEMKIKKALALVALPALGFALTSCGSKVENYGEDIVDIYNEAAEEMASCETASDIDDAVAAVEKLADEAKKLADEIEANSNKLRDEVYMELSIEELEEIEYTYRRDLSIADANCRDAVYHIREHIKGDRKAISKACDKLKHELNRAKENLAEAQREKH
jgi:hypothetical protein